MTTYERMNRILQHHEADRAPISDMPWGSTLERWRREGLPREMAWNEYFSVDPFPLIVVDSSPRYPWQLLEETGQRGGQLENLGVIFSFL